MTAFRTPGDLPAALERAQEQLVLATAAVYSAGYASVGLILLLLAGFIEGIALRRVPWRRSALDGYLLAFIGVFVVSGIVSSYRTVAIGSVVLAALTIYVAYGFLYRILAANPRFLPRFLWSWYVGGVGAAALAIYVFVTAGGPQAAVPALGPNALGSTLLMALMIGMGLVMTAPSPFRYLAGAGLPVIAVALALTTSRGAWIGAAAGIITLVLLSGRQADSAAHSRRVWSALIIVVAVALSLALLDGESAVLQKKLVSIIDVGRNQERIFLARSALAIAADHPLVGSGLNTFVLIHPHPSLRSDPLASKPRARVQSFAHNILLNMAAEGGLLGLIAFVAVIGRGITAGWRWHAAAGGRDRATSAAMLAALVGLLIHQQFDGTVSSVHISAGLWFLLAVMMAHEAVDSRRELPAHSR